MKTIIISYSVSGNNDALASSIAEEIGADHVKITHPRSKLTCGIITKHLLNMVPKVEPSPEIIDKYDFVILCGPIWMGKIVAPLRAYLDYLKDNKHRYAFISLCGGATGPNPGLSHELEKRVGNKPVFFIEYRKANLLTQDSKPVIKDTLDYRASDADIKKVADIIVKEFRKHI